MQEPPTTEPDPARGTGRAPGPRAPGPRAPGPGPGRGPGRSGATTRSRWRIIGPALAVFVLVVGATVTVLRLRQEEAAVAAPPVVTTTTSTTAAPTTTTTTEPPTTTTTMPPDPVPPRSTVTATLLGSTQGYDAPNGAPTKMVENNYYKIATKLSVIEQTPDGWLHVRLPYKPNSSTAWIRTKGVILDETPWAIQIDVTRKHLRLYNAGELVVDAPVGVGTAYTPTPLGDFFVTFLQKPESAAYGPFVMITTGHSEVLQSFGGFPDGILGIHGPIGSEYAIGDTGAAISNGCIRMKVADQVKLAQVTSGTPVHVYASPVPDAPPDPAPEPPPDAPPGSSPGEPDPGVGPPA